VFPDGGSEPALSQSLALSEAEWVEWVNRRYQTCHLLFPKPPGEEHVFLAQFAGVGDEREAKLVAVTVEIINALPIATFWLHSPDGNERNGISVDRVFAPRVAGAVPGEIDVERTIIFDHPNGADRVRPIADQRRRNRLRKPGATLQECEENSAGNKLNRTGYLHAGHRDWMLLAIQAQNVM
jgi:hypothetical protein